MIRSKPLKIVIGLLLLGVLVFVGRRHFGKLRLILDVSPFWVAAMAGLYLVTRLLNGEIVRLTGKALGKKLKRSECFFLVMVMSYQNLIIPKSGLTAPAIYLKHKYGLKLSHFTSFLLPTTILQLACFGLTGLAAQIYLVWCCQVPLQPALVLFFGFLFLGNAGLLFIPLRVPAGWQNRLGRFLNRFSEAWEQLRNNRPLIVKVIGWQLVIILLRAVRLQVAFWALAANVSLSVALIVSLLAQVALFISLTPGALGFREAAIAYGGYLLSVPSDLAVAVGLLDRAIMMGCIVAIGMPALWFIFLRKTPKLSGPDPASQPDDERPWTS
jgi:uncharacterized membrane protein YbhN (UPF0104 family)